MSTVLRRVLALFVLIVGAALEEPKTAVWLHNIRHMEQWISYISFVCDEVAEALWVELLIQQINIRSIL